LHGAQQAGLNLVLALAVVPAADVHVEGGQLADHLPQQVAQLRAVGDPGGQRLVLLAHRRPVQVVHVGVIEVVALEAPGLDEHLPELLAGVKGEGPVRQIHLGLIELLGAAEGGGPGGGIDHEEVVLLAEHEFLAVGGKLAAADVGHQSLGLVAFVRDIEALEGRDWR